MIGALDMDRAVKFYKEKLGLPLKFQTESYTEFETQGAVLALVKRDKIFVDAPLFTIPTQNAKEDFERFKKLEIEIREPLKKESFGWLFILKDSEGNIFEVVEYIK